MRKATIICEGPIDIEIVWADGTRNYLPMDKEIPDSRPAQK